MKSDTFFDILKHLGIRKSAKMHLNLLENVQLHKNVPDVVIDKVQKYLKEINKKLTLR